jgi:hypothetical protein
VTLDVPEVEFTASPGGECFVVVNLAGVDYRLAHMSVKGPFAWPLRTSRRLPIPGAGSWAFAVSATSVSQPVVFHADADVAYGPLAVTVAVVA